MYQDSTYSHEYEMRSYLRGEPDLIDSPSFFHQALEVHKKTKNYKATYQTMLSRYPSLASFELSKFQKACQDHFRFHSPPVSSTKAFQKSLEIHEESNAYYYQHLSSTEAKRLGPWSPDEEEHFIHVLHEIHHTKSYQDKNQNHQWGYISLHIYGRTGKQCFDKYKSLVEAQKIPDFFNEFTPTPKKITPFSKFTSPALMPEAEQQLVDYCDQRIEMNDLLTTNMLAFQALSYYYDPNHLAAKAALFQFYNQGLDPFINDGYSQEFQVLRSALIPLAETRPDILMETYQIPDFSASPSWVSLFMSNHDYVFRMPHFNRRGIINQEFIEKYLDELSEAVHTLPPEKILNMDETHVNLFNSNILTITHKGVETVNVGVEDNDDKIGTTYIGTISMDPKKRYPLILIAKGTTTRCETKYGEDPNVSSMHSYNGWCTTENMKTYLHLLAEWCEPPCVLVLDVFPAHRVQEIKELAESLKIKLIYVPACGTGTYQPLDRVIFGIVKKQLTSHARTDPITGDRSERFEKTNHLVSSVMHHLSNNAVNSAWEIPGLKEHYEAKYPEEAFPNFNHHEDHP